MKPTESQTSTATKLERIAWLSKEDSNKEFGGLMHHFNEESLRTCYKELDARKAPGFDGVTKEEYGKNLDANLQNLVHRLKQMAYRPGPVLKVLIPDVNNVAPSGNQMANSENKPTI